MREMASIIANVSLLVVVLLFSVVCGRPSDRSYGAVGGTQSTAPKGDDPMLNMFRNFVANFPPYANPLNYIPAQAFGPYGPYPFSPGGTGQPNYGQWGVGYSGPYHGQGYGVPNPAYGGIPGLDTRIAGGASGGTTGTDSTVVRTNDDGSGVSVSVQSPPDGKPMFRSKTVQGPNSYGTAFAYSSG